ncbi:MAG: peptidoglycan-binding protein [Granulosicoccus sp.]|nr:peptidoglycan-binding protein [Granulosicoccus sp.]
MYRTIDTFVALRNSVRSKGLNFFKFCGFGILSALISSCAATVDVPVVVAPPTDLNMERVSIYPVKDKNSQERIDVTDEIESIFVNSIVKGVPAFDVTAMNELGTIVEQKRIEEQALGGYFDQSTVSSLRAKGVQGLVFATLDEDPTTSEKVVEIDKKEVTCLERTVRSTIRTKIVRTSDGQIQFQRAYSGEASKNNCDGSSLGSGVDAELGREARAEALGKMRRDIAPYTRDLKATILTNFCKSGGSGFVDKYTGKILKGSTCDNSQPEQRVVDLVKGGELFLKGERMDRACKQWNEAASLHSDGFVIPYLLGICTEIQEEDLQKALAYFQQADDRATVPIDPIREAMERLQLKMEEKNINPRSASNKSVRIPDPNVLEVQRALAELNYDPGPVDGFMGEKTAEALRFFQESENLEVTGEIDTATRDALNL